MSGEIVYQAPRRHSCDTPDLEPLGSVWRCGQCGAHWRMDVLPLSTRASWHPMSRFAVWRFKRKQARAERRKQAARGETG